MSAITTHILDTSRGRPATGVAVRLERRDGDRWQPLGEGTTDADGRLGTLLPSGERPAAGVYRLRFATGDYFERLGVEGFYPQVTLEFHLREPTEHYHVPLLLNPFGYSTYRGS